MPDATLAASYQAYKCSPVGRIRRLRRIRQPCRLDSDYHFTVIDKNPAVWAKSSLPFCHATLPRRDTR
ncbi:hypothetical protein KZ770_13065 [Escherichia coli]|nr:hypothetical protein [Escherichia coli]